MRCAESTQRSCDPGNRSLNFAVAMARPTSYSPLIIPIVRACATFGATAEEIANYLNIPWGSFKRWIYAEPELREALKRGRDASDERVVESLYRKALTGDVGACCFWLKNRRPSEWRDVQHIDQATGVYLISDKPMSEAEWIAARADAAKPIASPKVSTSDNQTAKPLD